MRKLKQRELTYHFDISRELDLLQVDTIPPAVGRGEDNLLHALVVLLIINPDLGEASKRKAAELGGLVQVRSRQGSPLDPSSFANVAKLLQFVGLGDVVDADLRIAVFAGDIVVESSERTVGFSLEGEPVSGSPSGALVIATLVDVVVGALEVETMENSC